MTKRNTNNHNHTLHYDAEYAGFDLHTANAPYILPFLDRFHTVMQRVLQSHKRVLAVKFDLHLPTHTNPYLQRNAITEFIERVKAGIVSYQNAVARRNQRVYPTEVEYVAKVEQTTDSELEHYHVVLFTNKDTLYPVGNLSHEDPTKLGQIIRQAWLKTHGLSADSRVALLHTSTPVFRVLQGPLSTYDPVHRDAFLHFSYLCKEKTTKYQGKRQSFYSSNAKNKAPA
ncbi:YagK/YfjJ domain-containing protein [Idiomarina aquatica]|uniref:YagK/YfjJ C-terminal domain-containing protein n=1 Tax=Idiomarina aquatica TaxID=1327752 RepID=A0AA94EDN9_9GAMM|nr:inovirus-type Gp2 protein [Idiomarina aquatica]RUO40294.1 hypothetical protein CWE23_11855 [Idiomarina aquatica]